jgi:phosphoribosyl 1,2-cyclic phosphodiesterase
MTTPESNSTEIILLGTGASSSVPHVECLTALPGQRTCKTCHSALTPQGKKNNRRNTSCAIRMTAKDGRKVCVAGDVYVRRVARSLNRTIVIDAGKNFQAAALEWFPKYGLRRIDALLISHAHADGMFSPPLQTSECGLSWFAQLYTGWMICVVSVFRRLPCV